MQITNKTPFILERFLLFDKNGSEIIVIVLKATYSLHENTEPTVAEEQDPLNMADIYVDEPGESGLLLEGEFMPLKPSTGITLTGHAVAPNVSTKEIVVELRIGKVIQQAIVYGPRLWSGFLGVLRIRGPESFEKIPLTWENAYGGFDNSSNNDKHHEAHADNPVGKGFVARKTSRNLDGLPLPNIEHPQHRIRSIKDRPPPVGFCPVAPNWPCRAKHAGIYDEKWQNERATLLPDDFDERFYQTAPPGLVADSYLMGGEECLVVGTTPGGRLVFRLPAPQPSFIIFFSEGKRIMKHAVMDTVHIDTDAMKLHLVWRAVAEVQGRVELISSIQAYLRGKPSNG